MLPPPRGENDEKHRRFGKNRGKFPVIFYILAGIVIGLIFSLGFTSYWAKSPLIAWVSEKTGLETAASLSICRWTGIAASVPFTAMSICFALETYAETLKQKILSYRFLVRPALILWGLNLFGILSVLRANFNYVDDMRRVLSGYSGWMEAFSRYAPEFLSPFLHMDAYLGDVSPLSQIIAALIIAIAGAIIVYVISGQEQPSIWLLISSLPLGLSPYFLNCYSYKYDSPYMALSVLASVFPLLFYRSKPLRYGIASFFGVLIVCVAYQASSGIYPIFVILMALRLWSSGEKVLDTLRFLLVSVISYIAAILVFMFALMEPVAEGTYASNSLPGFMEFIPNLIKNFNQYFKLVYSDMKPDWRVLLLMLLIAWLFVSAFNTEREKIAALLAHTLGVVLMCLLVFGLYPALSAPIFAPRAMYGLGALIAFLCVELVSFQNAVPFRIIPFALVWSFLTFSFIYGNMLFIQKEYTDFRIQAVIHDLKDLDFTISGEKDAVRIEGSIGHAPAVVNASSIYPVIQRLTPITFQGDWYWGKYGFFNYYALKNLFQNDNIETDLPLLKDTMYHTIWGKDGYIRIRLK